MMGSFDVISAWIFFIIQVIAFIFAAYVAKRVITDRYQARMEKPPYFLSTRYLIAACVSLAVIFFVPVMKAHAVLYQETYSVMPWYGSETVLIVLRVAAVFCSFAAAYLTDDKR